MEIGPINKTGEPGTDAQDVSALDVPVQESSIAHVAKARAGLLVRGPHPLNLLGVEQTKRLEDSERSCQFGVDFVDPRRTSTPRWQDVRHRPSEALQVHLVEDAKVSSHLVKDGGRVLSICAVQRDPGEALEDQVRVRNGAHSSNGWCRDPESSRPVTGPRFDIQGLTRAALDDRVARLKDDALRALVNDPDSARRIERRTDRVEQELNVDRYRLTLRASIHHTRLSAPAHERLQRTPRETRVLKR